VSPAPDLALVERFKAALDRLNPGGGRIGLAVSGGPDSMAMLLLAHAAIPGQFEVATVNHGLRPEAADECALVAAACAERGVDCAVLEVTVGAGNVQAKAREARYAALAEWASQHNIRAIATAHHADDQAETLLMRLNRGSGLAGLSGVRAHGWLEEWPDIAVIRPLLHFRRAELASIVQQAGVPSVADPSNHDDRFDRVRIRKAMAEATWLDPLAMSRSATHLAEENEALDWAAGSVWRECGAAGEGRITLRRGSEPHAIVLRLVTRAFTTLGASVPASDVARLVYELYLGRGGNVGGVLATVEGDVWVFRPEPPRRSK
jgi:tRNA(Ile)-lysidine synthase